MDFQILSKFKLKNKKLQLIFIQLFWFNQTKKRIASKSLHDHPKVSIKLYHSLTISYFDCNRWALFNTLFWYDLKKAKRVCGSVVSNLNETTSFGNKQPIRKPKMTTNEWTIALNKPNTQVNMDCELTKKILELGKKTVPDGRCVSVFPYSRTRRLFECKNKMLIFACRFQYKCLFCCEKFSANKDVQEHVKEAHRFTKKPTRFSWLNGNALESRICISEQKTRSWDEHSMLS